MDEPIHIAITRRVRKSHVAEFERALAEFASRSLAEPGARGVHCLHPPPGSASTEYGILRSFATNADRDAFYDSPLYKNWLEQIEPMVEGEPAYRQLDGLEAWFRDPHSPMPPRWKMALLTWIAVWPVSMLVRAILAPLLGPNFPQVLGAGVTAAGIVVVLTWVAMPLLVKAAHVWLHPKRSLHP
ncbi:MAG TPA: antibiotic biosynthesis monooxygenase [Terrimicrobiaceae bacterium]